MVEQEKFDAAFPTRLRGLIKERGTTITAIAKELGISRQAVSQYADGTGQPNVDKLVLIAKYFGVSTDYLVGIAEYESPQNEHILAKDLGLSERSVNILKFYAGYPEFPAFIQTLNLLIEQEIPAPDGWSTCCDEGMTMEEREEENQRLEREAEEDYERWMQKGYCPILSVIDDFLSIERSKQKYDLLGTGEILKKRDGRGFRSIRIGALRTIQASDILERVLLSEIEGGLKKLKDHTASLKN